nr:MAG TPA: hypothetical protein [Caudoviricetes sp.]
MRMMQACLTKAFVTGMNLHGQNLRSWLRSALHLNADAK